MKVYRGLDSVDPPLEGVTLTIGNFDGVHRGHQQIFAQTCLSASRGGGTAMAMTFDPAPQAVIAPEAATGLLTPLDERLEQIAHCGMRAAVVVDADRQLLNLSPEQFVCDVLLKRFKPRRVVEGTGWRFGKGRAGNVETLAQFGARYGFAVEVVPDLTIQLEPGGTVTISSTLIRDLIARGQMDQVSACLGRPYAIIGPVQVGVGRGRSLGYPTANVGTCGHLLPADGVYAGRALVSGAWVTAAVSVGPAPTFERDESVVEAHLLDFDRAIYGERVRLELLRFVRAQMSFDSADALRKQIERDVRHIRAIVKTAS